MIESIEGLPEGVLGFNATGHVSGEDYEQVLVPAVEGALETHAKLSLLYVLGEAFEGYEAAAMWEDTKVGMHHLSSWKRIALVTDHEAYRATVKAFGVLISAEVKVFDTAELEQAKEWISAT